MSGYGGFAAWYDRLMERVDYPGRAAYLLELFRRHAGKRPASLLDLACGTGTLTRLLAQQGIEMTGVDASAEMLSAARAADPAGDVLWVCQDLRALDLYGTCQGAVCTLDGINHLAGEGDLAAFFGRLRYFIEPGGLFLFDCNTPYKHQTVLADNTFVYDTPAVYCVWQNRTDPTGKTAVTLDFFAPDAAGAYRRERETFCERAYDAAALTAAAEPFGFTCLAAYRDMTFSPPAATDERVVYVMKKDDAI